MDDNTNNIPPVTPEDASQPLEGEWKEVSSASAEEWSKEIPAGGTTPPAQKPRRRFHLPRQMIPDVGPASSTPPEQKPRRKFLLPRRQNP